MRCTVPSRPSPEYGSGPAVHGSAAVYWPTSRAPAANSVARRARPTSAATPIPTVDRFVARAGVGSGLSGHGDGEGGDRRRGGEGGGHSKRRSKGAGHGVGHAVHQFVVGPGHGVATVRAAFVELSFEVGNLPAWRVLDGRA